MLWDRHGYFQMRKRRTTHLDVGANVDVPCACLVELHQHLHQHQHLYLHRSSSARRGAPGGLGGLGGLGAAGSRNINIEHKRGTSGRANEERLALNHILPYPTYLYNPIHTYIRSEPRTSTLNHH